MSDFSISQSRSTAFIALIMTIDAIAPLVTYTRAFAQTAICLRKSWLLIRLSFVAQRKLQPLATNTTAASYILAGTGSNNSNTTSNSQ